MMKTPQEANGIVHSSKNNAGTQFLICLQVYFGIVVFDFMGIVLQKDK